MFPLFFRRRPAYDPAKAAEFERQVKRGEIKPPPPKFPHPANAKFNARIQQVPAPPYARDPRGYYDKDGYRLDTHSDIVEVLRRLAPEGCFHIDYGQALLVHPNGVIFGGASGMSGIALRFPGMRAPSVVFDAGGERSYADADWVHFDYDWGAPEKGKASFGALRQAVAAAYERAGELGKV